MPRRSLGVQFWHRGVPDRCVLACCFYIRRSETLGNGAGWDTTMCNYALQQSRRYVLQQSRRVDWAKAWNAPFLHSRGNCAHMLFPLIIILLSNWNLVSLEHYKLPDHALRSNQAALFTNWRDFTYRAADTLIGCFPRNGTPSCILHQPLGILNFFYSQDLV